MKATWRKHLIICLSLGLLSAPIYFVDQALFAPTGGSNWITLDFRGVLVWSYLIWAAIYVGLSSIALLFFRTNRRFRFHLGLTALSLILLVGGFVVYERLHNWAISNRERVLMESRRPRINVIELKEWWYVPDEIHPAEIRVSVVVHESGRFAGNVTGEQTDSSGASRTVFESTNEPERQRQVGSGEAFIYAFPLKVLQAAHADNVRITLYLFKARSGPAAGDIAKVFMKSPPQEDDGEYFYGVLPAPSRPAQ